MDHLLALADEWRSRAATLRTWGAGDDLARAYERAAMELEERLRESADELISLTEAARLTGRSERTIRNWVEGGKLENRGRKGSPLFRRSDLPIRATPAPSAGGFDVDAHVRRIQRRAS